VNILDKYTVKKRNIFLSILIITFISSITIFLIPNMSRGHDLAFHLSRILGVYNNINDGNIFNIYSNYINGYGYGNPLFYPDLFLYLPAILKKLGLTLIQSYKIFIILINFTSIISMYFSTKAITKNKNSALISSIIYGFSSYRLIDLFTRAALGESLAFIFAPLIIYGIYEIIYNDYKKFYILIIGMTGLILSHIISSYMIIILLIIICLINIKKLVKEKKRLLYLILSAITTLLLTSYFLIPMIEQMLSTTFYVNLNQSTVLYERTVPIWGLFIEYPYYMNLKPWIPAGIGISFIISSIYFIKNYKKTSSFTKTCFILGIIFLFMTTKIFPWKTLEEIFSVIQFPWRFYYLSTILLTIGTGLLVNELKNKIKFNNLIVFIIVSILPIITIVISNFNEKIVTGIKDYEIAYKEYLPAKANIELIEKRGIKITTTYNLEHTFIKNNNNIDINFVNNNTDNSLELPLLYYKGYEAKLNNKNLEIRESDNGLVLIKITKDMNDGTIYVKYTGTNIQRITRYISIITFTLFTSYIIIRKVGEKNEKER